MLAVSVGMKSGDETEEASYYRTSIICRKPVSVVSGNTHASMEIEGLNCVVCILLRFWKNVTTFSISISSVLVGVESTEKLPKVDG